MKITILGDIMCEPPILKASKCKDGSYNFDDTFAKIRPMLSEADYVIGNMEFPCAGEEAGYTNGFFSFNAPDSFAKAIKDAGIDVVSTVNNHTLDRGFDGMVRTLRVLDEINLPHTGSFLPEKGRENAYYFEVDGVKFALVASTYATNKKPAESDYDYINFLKPFEMKHYLPEVEKKLFTWVDRRFNFLKGEVRSRIKMCVGLPPTIARADDYTDTEVSQPYIDVFINDIKTAKENADFVICYPHIGGQFNLETGAFSKYVVSEAFKAGADAVLASHSHVVQEAGFTSDGKPYAYSLGNVNMSINGITMVKENLPEYGIALHMYMDKTKVTKVTFSIIKAIEKKGTKIVAWPVDMLYKELKSDKERKKLADEVCFIHKTITGKNPEGDIFQKEYLL